MFEGPYSFNTLRAFKVQVQTAIKHASDTTGACLWKVWSITLEGLEHCSGRSRALLLEAGSIAIGGWGHCYWNTKACLSGVRKHVF